MAYYRPNAENFSNPYFVRDISVVTPSGHHYQDCSYIDYINGIVYSPRINGHTYRSYDLNDLFYNYVREKSKEITLFSLDMFGQKHIVRELTKPNAPDGKWFAKGWCGNYGKIEVYECEDVNEFIDRRYADICDQCEKIWKR